MRDRRPERTASLWLGSLLAFGGGAGAASESALEAGTDGIAVPQLTVVSSTPLPGANQNRDQVPMSSQVLDAQDVNRTGIASLTGALREGMASVSINDTEGNVFQPDILFRGFTASPIAGTRRAYRCM